MNLTSNQIDNFINFPVMSIKSGSKSTFVFFENENFQGKHFVFGKSSFKFWFKKSPLFFIPLKIYSQK